MLMQFQLSSTLFFQIELLIPDVRSSDLEFSSVLTKIDWAEFLPDDMIRELFRSVSLVESSSAKIDVSVK